MSLTIRQATSADLPTLLEFEQGVVIAERPFNSKIRDGTVHYYDLAALIANDLSMVLIAEVDGVAIGCGHGTIRKSDDFLVHERNAYLGLMYVDPAYRGQGVAQQVIQNLLDWSRGHGVHDFYLDVYADNDAAVRAYEKFGFRSSLIEMKMHDD